MEVQELKEQIAKRLKEGMIKDFNELYVKEFSTTWKMERWCRKTELNLMKVDNTTDSILSLLDSPDSPYILKSEVVKRIREIENPYDDGKDNQMFYRMGLINAFDSAIQKAVDEVKK